MTSKIFLLFGVVTVHCGAELPSTITLAPVEELRQATTEAADAVNKVLGAEFVLQGPSGIPVRVSNETECGTDVGKEEILLNDECATKYAAIVIVHEVGHALGLDHSDNRRSVMFPFVNRGMTVDQAAWSLAEELTRSNKVLLPPNAP